MATEADWIRISEWERKTGKTLAIVRRKENRWQDVGSADVPF